MSNPPASIADAGLLERPSGVPQAFDSPRDRALYRRVPHRPGVELYRAEIVDHAFAPHAHDAFGIGAVEWGVERFRYRGSDHLAGPGSLVLMDDDELHTGRADTDQGWRYRMVYVDAPLLAELCGQPVQRFAQPAVDDPALGLRVTTALDGLIMGTRCGTLDPGVLLHLLNQGHTAQELQHLLYEQSRLLGLSGLSADMRTLRASSDPACTQAIALFTARLMRQVGAMHGGQPSGAGRAHFQWRDRRKRCCFTQGALRPPSLAGRAPGRTRQRPGHA